MTAQRQPNLQPLTAIPLLAHVLDGQLEALENQCIALQRASSRPGSMDDATIDRVLQVFSDTRTLMPVYDAQIEHWRNNCSPSLAQRREIDRLAAQITKLYAAIDRVLGLASEIKSATIEALTGDDETAAGLAAAGAPPRR